MTPMNLITVLCVFHMFLLLPLSSENINTNGTSGAPYLWQCQYDLSEKFDLQDIYWQDQNGAVLHVYRKGKEEFEHQHQFFKDRTKIFPDQLPLGNLSLVIEPLMLKDDNKALEVVLPRKTGPKKLCQTMLHVAAPFQSPNITVNKADMTATCSTKGGYPKPELKWSSGDGGADLEPHQAQTNMTPKGDGTYSVISTANISGLQTVTCRVYNPTSNQTLSATEPMTPPETPGRSHSGIVIASAIGIFGVIGIIVCPCFYKRRPANNETEQRTEEEPRPSSSNSRGENVSPENPSANGALEKQFPQTCREGEQKLVLQLTEKGAAFHQRKESTADSDAADPKEKLLHNNGGNESSTSESDKDK